MKILFTSAIAILLIVVSCAANPQRQPSAPDNVRGIWMPDPKFTPALTSYDRVVETMNLLQQLKFNTLFVCTYVQYHAAFKSETLFKNGNFKSIDDTQMQGLRGYTGGSGDCLKDVIAEAHKRQIKVIFWFEYGFEVSHGAPTDANPVYAKNPHWVGRANNGDFANYNGTDYYYNSYDPVVQQFLLDLVAESMAKYPDVDGIQGDDRMPAAPRNSGYDNYTRERYKKEKGVYPPHDFQNGEWVRWRLDILNNFGRELYNTVKSFGSDKMVCFSPNPYPWCEENLMQDWPSWLKMGIVDLLSVQCYRYTAASYKATTDEALKYIKANTSKNVFNPGIILRGSTDIPADVLRAQMEQNRTLHSNGEAFFWYEAIKEPAIKQVIESFYK